MARERGGMKRVTDRWVWQAVVLVAVMTLGLLHTLDNAYPSPHSLCPFGGLATLYSLLQTGEFIHRVHSSAVFLLLAVVLTALVAGRAFCGRLCPFGTVHELVYRTGRRLGVNRKTELPERAHRVLKYLKYVVLVLLLYYTWTAGKLIYRAWCPWSAFMTIFDPAEVIDDILMGGLILLGLLGVGLFVERFFCKYLCPLGAAVGLFNRFSLIKPRRNGSCVHCGLCDSACPARIKVSACRTVTDAECIHCYRCLKVCPDQKSMSFNFPRLRLYLVALLILVVFFSTVAYSVAAGYWQRGRVFVRPSEPAYATEGISEDLHDIRASTRLAEVAERSGLELAEILTAAGLPEDLPPDTTLRELSEEFSVTRRDMLLLLQGLLDDDVEKDANSNEHHTEGAVPDAPR